MKHDAQKSLKLMAFGGKIQNQLDRNGFKFLSREVWKDLIRVGIQLEYDLAMTITTQVNHTRNRNEFV